MNCGRRWKRRRLYPQEYAVPIHPAEGGGSQGVTSQIVASHSLIPQALYHAFSTFGTLMSPDLPLQRRHHEMIATRVSVTNRACIESSLTQSFCVGSR